MSSGRSPAPLVKSRDGYPQFPSGCASCVHGMTLFFKVLFSASVQGGRFMPGANKKGCCALSRRVQQAARALRATRVDRTGTARTKPENRQVDRERRRAPRALGGFRESLGK